MVHLRLWLAWKICNSLDETRTIIMSYRGIEAL